MNNLNIKPLLPYIMIIFTVAMSWGMVSERLEAVEKKSDSISQMQQDIAVIKEKIIWIEEYLIER
jgi:hypothetical protein